MYWSSLFMSTALGGNPPVCDIRVSFEMQKRVLFCTLLCTLERCKRKHIHVHTQARRSLAQRPMDAWEIERESARRVLIRGEKRAGRRRHRGESERRLGKENLLLNILHNACNLCLLALIAYTLPDSLLGARMCIFNIMKIGKSDWRDWSRDFVFFLFGSQYWKNFQLRMGL